MLFNRFAIRLLPLKTRMVYNYYILLPQEPLKINSAITIQQVPLREHSWVVFKLLTVISE